MVGSIWFKNYFSILFPDIYKQYVKKGDEFVWSREATIDFYLKINIEKLLLNYKLIIKKYLLSSWNLKSLIYEQVFILGYIMPAWGGIMSISACLIRGLALCSDSGAEGKPPRIFFYFSRCSISDYNQSIK